jgi:hypothetical protein
MLNSKKNGGNAISVTVGFTWEKRRIRAIVRRIHILDGDELNAFLSHLKLSHFVFRWDLNCIETG